MEPERFFGDKIYLNRENRKTLKNKGIQIMGRPLGRPPKNPTDEQVERERIAVSLRNEAEALFGTAKRTYRANNIRAKLPETAECWTAMCYFVKNLRVYQNEGLGTPSIFKLPENRMNWRDPIFGWISGISDSQGV